MMPRAGGSRRSAQGGALQQQGGCTVQRASLEWPQLTRREWGVAEAVTVGKGFPGPSLGFKGKSSDTLWHEGSQGGGTGARDKPQLLSLLPLSLCSSPAPSQKPLPPIWLLKWSRVMKNVSAAHGTGAEHAVGKNMDRSNFRAGEADRGPGVPHEQRGG